MQGTDNGKRRGDEYSWYGTTGTAESEGQRHGELEGKHTRRNRGLHRSVPEGKGNMRRKRHCIQEFKRSQLMEA